MSTRNSLRHRCGRCFFALGILGLLAALVLGGETKERGAKEPAEERAANREAKETAKMVEAIVNRNKPPKIVGSRKREPPNKFPLFPKDYDWKEEERVRAAVMELYQDTSIELWETLVQRKNDKRYCVTLWNGYSENGFNYSVGMICINLAHDRLCRVFTKHLPRVRHGSPIDLANVNEDLLAWRNKRKDKSLYELQIEVCEMAIQALPKVAVRGFSDDKKAEARKKIEAEITTLRKTRQPIIEKRPRFIPAYRPEIAKRIRQAFENGSLDQLDLGGRIAR